MDNTIKTQMLQKYKEEFCELLRSTQRDGMENLISWLENETDFFTQWRNRNRDLHS